MNSRERKIYEWLLERPGYTKWNALKVSKISGLPGYPKEFEKALKMAKNALKANKTVRETDVKFKRLFFDIETSFNIVALFAIGNKVSVPYDAILKERAIICISYKWAHEDEVHTFTWDKGDDKKLLLNFMKVMNDADEVIGHNSDNYDIKFLRTRCLYHKIPMFPDYISSDTLKFSRNKFRFNSNRLDYLGQYMGFGGKVETGGLKLWKQIVLNNCQESLAKMVNYCEGDVLLLENVFNTLNPYVPSKIHVGAIINNDKCSCPNCGSVNSQKNGYRVTASGMRKLRLQCQDCGKYYTIPIKKEK